MSPKDLIRVLLGKPTLRERQLKELTDQRVSGFISENHQLRDRIEHLMDKVDRVSQSKDRVTAERDKLQELLKERRTKVKDLKRILATRKELEEDI